MPSAVIRPFVGLKRLTGLYLTDNLMRTEEDIDIDAFAGLPKQTDIQGQAIRE